MASVTEATFNWGGFLAAMGSNITFQSRNVLSKKFMGKDTKVQQIHGCETATHCQRHCSFAATAFCIMSAKPLYTLPPLHALAIRIPNPECAA